MVIELFSSFHLALDERYNPLQRKLKDWDRAVRGQQRDPHSTALFPHPKTGTQWGLQREVIAPMPL